MADILTIMFLLIFAILVLTVVYISQSYLKTQKIERLGGIMPHLDAAMTACMKEIAANSELKETLLGKRKGDIDSRMQYVLDHAEQLLSRHGVQIETDDLYLHAQSIFYQLKEDSTTSV